MSTLAPRFLLLMLAIAAGIMIVGSQGRKEPEDLAFVSALGLDRGSQNKLALTAAIAVPAATGQQSMGGGGGGGGGTKKPFFVTTVEAPDLFGALDSMNTYISRQLNLMHVEALVFGSSLAESGLGKYIDGLLRYREFRETPVILIARGTAKTFIDKVSPILEQNPGTFLSTLAQSGRINSLSYVQRLHYFVSAMQNKTASPIAQLAAVQEPVSIEIPSADEPEGQYKPAGQEETGAEDRQGGGKIDVLGTALFDDDRMVGELDGTETLMLYILRGELSRTFLSIPDPQKPDMTVSVNLKQDGKPRIKVERTGDSVAFSIHCKLTMEIMAIQSDINYGDPNQGKILEQYAGLWLSERAQQVMAKLQMLKVDSAQLGSAIKKGFLTQPEWEDYGWLDRFPSARVDIAAEVRIARTSLISKIYPSGNGRSQ